MEIKYEVPETERDKEASEKSESKDYTENKEQRAAELGAEGSESSAALDPARELLSSETDATEKYKPSESNEESEPANDTGVGRSVEDSSPIEESTPSPESTESGGVQKELSPGEQSTEVSNDPPSDLTGQLENSRNFVQIDDKFWVLPAEQEGQQQFGFGAADSAGELRQEIRSNHEDLRFYENVRNAEIGYETYRTGALESDGKNALVDCLNALLGIQETDRQRDDIAQYCDAMKDGPRPYTEKYPAEPEEEDVEKK